MGGEREIGKSSNGRIPTHHALATSIPQHGAYEHNLCSESLARTRISAKSARRLLVCLRTRHGGGWLAWPLHLRTSREITAFSQTLRADADESESPRLFDRLSWISSDAQLTRIVIVDTGSPR
jgi:hypothetical protein